MMNGISDHPRHADRNRRKHGRHFACNHVADRHTSRRTTANHLQHRCDGGIVQYACRVDRVIRRRRCEWLCSVGARCDRQRFKPDVYFIGGDAFSINCLSHIRGRDVSQSCTGIKHGCDGLKRQPECNNVHADRRGKRLSLVFVFRPSDGSNRQRFMGFTTTANPLGILGASVKDVRHSRNESWRVARSFAIDEQCGVIGCRRVYVEYQRRLASVYIGRTSCASNGYRCGQWFNYRVIGRRRHNSGCGCGQQAVNLYRNCRWFGGNYRRSSWCNQYHRGSRRAWADAWRGRLNFGKRLHSGIKQQ